MKKVLFLIYLFLFPLNIFSQEESFSVTLSPRLELPLKSQEEESAAGSSYVLEEYLSEAGFGFSGEVELRSPDVPLLFVYASGDYKWWITKGEKIMNVDIFSIGAGGGLSIPMMDFFYLKTSAWGGVYLAEVNSRFQNSFFWGVRGAAQFRVNPMLYLALGGGYVDYLDVDINQSFLRNTYVSLETSFTPGNQAPMGIKTEASITDPVFPAKYRHYNTNPLGYIHIENREKREIRNLSVLFLVDGYSDIPRECGVLESLPSGGRTSIPIYSLFNENVFSLSSEKIVPGKILISYLYGGRKVETEKKVALRILERNAVYWGEEEMLNTFITYKEELIYGLSRDILKRSGVPDHLDRNFIKGMALFQGLSETGLSYSRDPSGKSVSLKDVSCSVDYIQFPPETLNIGTGDCDDLAVLYASLLESVGIPTAFITTPDHIFIAFALENRGESVSKIFRNPENFIWREGRAWVPVETTLISEGFLKAWQEGAAAWREINSRMDTRFYITGMLRSEYQDPPGLIFEGQGITLPGEKALKAGFSEIFEMFVESEIGEIITRLIASSEYREGKPEVYNRIGALYCRYNRFAEAEEAFLRCLASEEYLPALVNLGNLYYFTGDRNKSLEYSLRALEQEPECYSALLLVEKLNKQISEGESISGSLKEAVALQGHGYKASEAGLFNDPLIWIGVD